MKIEQTPLPDLLLIRPSVYRDERGYFSPIYRQNDLSEYLGCAVDFVQDNLSSSHYGVLRGLHYQKPPYTQAKLVYVPQGRVWDVCVDLRADSPTYGQWAGFELSSDNLHMLHVPRGFAHGFVSMAEDTLFHYKVDASYSPSHEATLAYDDPTLQIDWQLPVESLILSDKDKQGHLFSPHQRYF